MARFLARFMDDRPPPSSERRNRGCQIQKRSLRSLSHSTPEARLLFLASLAIRGQNHGRRAANHAKRPSRNRPSESTKRSMDGKSKSNSSEITFTTANPTPRASAARATAAASISTACAPNESRRLRLLRRVRNGSETHQHALPAFQSHAAPIAGIDHPERLENMRHLKPRIERSGKPDGIDYARRVECDHRLRSSPCRLGADSPADQHDIILLKESKSPSVDSLLADSPIFDETAHLTLKRCDNGDSRHKHSPGTTPPPAAMPLRQERSSIPTRARPLQSWRTFSSCPYAQYRRSPAVPSSTVFR